jgi:hypothetical protein
MKKILKTTSSLLLIAFALTLSQCAKETNTCKTCRVVGLGPDQQPIEKKICTPEEEQAFKNANPGKEISCQ